MKENKDKKVVLIIKQVLNGIALSFFASIIIYNFLPLDVYWYKELPDLFFSDFMTTLMDRIVLSIILILVCISLVIYKKNINEYLKLITYSELIIIPLVLLLIFNLKHISIPIYNILEYIVKILNVSLPFIFYLKLVNKKEDEVNE